MTGLLIAVLAIDLVVATGFACGATVGRDSMSWKDYARCCGAALAAVVVTFVTWRFVVPALPRWAFFGVHWGAFGVLVIEYGSYWTGSFVLWSFLHPRPRRWFLFTSVTAVCRLATAFLMAAAFGALR